MQIKTIAAIISSMTLAAGTLRAAPAEDTSVQEAKALIQAFASELKGNLQSAVKEGGFPAGIEVCSVKAPGIAAAKSVDGWQVSRTSLKPRNPANTPETWEREVLRHFEERLARGEPISDLVFKEVAMQDGVEEFRFMKAIPTQQMCLGCHGSALSAEVQKVLDERYPEDQAKGYKVGQIRGAFSLRQSLSN